MGPYKVKMQRKNITSHKQNSGFSLLEILLVLSLSLILSYFAYESLSNYYLDYRAKLTMQTIKNAINKARFLSKTRNEDIILTPKDNTLQLHNKFGEILYTWNLDLHKINLSFHGFIFRNSLVFMPKLKHMATAGTVLLETVNASYKICLNRVARSRDCYEN
jgi:prepilin-type N-terminal cleavage/methylation domain-containing protein